MEISKMTNDQGSKFEEWAIIELFGHQQIAGRVTEQTIGAATFIRVDVPKKDGSVDYTRFFNPSSVYSLSPVTEQIAIGFVLAHEVVPVTRYDLQKLAGQKMIDGGVEEED